MVRVFAIGNGPSLTSDMLARLGLEHTIGMNRLWMHPGLTFDPTYWVMADMQSLERADDIQGLLSVKSELYVNEHLLQKHDINPDVHVIDWCQHVHSNRPDEWHLPGWCSYGGSAAWAAQLAFEKGYDELYFIGCDLFEPWEPETPDPNHFHPDYARYRFARGEYIVPDMEATNDGLIHGHEVAKRELETREIAVYNATRGGKLEVYERVDFDSLF